LPKKLFSLHIGILFKIHKETMPRSPFIYVSEILILLKFGFILGGVQTTQKNPMSAVFTFASGHPYKLVLSVVRVHWAVRIGCEQELSVVYVHWTVHTNI
jgi:hypothetical protein